MCVIIYLPTGTNVSKDELKEAFDYNDDGAGIAWIKDDKINYSKGYRNFNEFYNTHIDVINDSSIDRVIHFRITSRGKTSPAQCHPFLLSDKKRDMELLNYQGSVPVLFMNGTIMKQKLLKDLNDTASFIIKELDNNSCFNDKKILDKIGLTGAKWCILETDGVTLIGDFVVDDGVYYSNLYHRNYKKYYYYDDLNDDDWWNDKDFYAAWLESRYGPDIADIYYDCLYYDGMSPDEALTVAVDCGLEEMLVHDEL